MIGVLEWENSRVMGGYKEWCFYLFCVFIDYNWLQCALCLLHSAALQCTCLFPTVQHCSAPACFPQCSTAVQGVVVSGCCHIFPTAAVGPLRPSREDELQVSCSSFRGWGMFKLELQTIHLFSQSGRRPLLGPSSGWKHLLSHLRHYAKQALTHGK